MRRRFYVAVVRGYTIPLRPTRMSHNRKPGVTAHVLDRAYLHRVISSYYSDTRGGNRWLKPNRERQVIRQAREEARRLNAWDRAQR